MAKLTEIVIALVIFSVIIYGFSLIWAETTNEYGVTYTENISSQFNKINDTWKDVEAMSTKLQNASTQEATAVDSMVASTYSAMRLFFNSFGLVKAVIEMVAIMFVIPTWIVSAVLTIILITIVGAILSAFFKRDI